jgi:hypothetical protein
VRSISSAALAAPAKAASAAASGAATKVTTERLCQGSTWVSRTYAPGVAAMASRMAPITAGRRPSL